MKKCLMLFLISLLLTAFATWPAKAQDYPDFATLRIVQMKYEPYPAEAGKYMKLFVKVENQGLKPAENVVCELDPRFPFSIDTNEEAIREIGRLPALDDVVLEYKVRVDPDAVNGENELRLKCDTEGFEDRSYVVHKLTIDVESKSPEFAIGLMKSLPSEIKADMKDVKLTVELQNIGNGDAKLTTTDLQLPEGFSPSESYSTSYNLGNVPVDISAEAVFYIDTAEGLAEGIYTANLLIKYKDDNNNENLYGEQNLKLELRVKPSPSLIVDEVRAGTGTSSDTFTGYVLKGETVVNPSTLSQGGSGELRIKVRNAGEQEAERVSVKLFKDSSQPFEFDEIYDFIGNLKPNQSSDAVFMFTVDGNAVLKKYLIDVEMRFVEGSEVETQQATIPLEVSRAGMDMRPIISAVLIVVVAVALFVWKRKK
jgi:hypothetical protein